MDKKRIYRDDVGYVFYIDDYGRHIPMEMHPKALQAVKRRKRIRRIKSTIIEYSIEAAVLLALVASGYATAVLILSL